MLRIFAPGTILLGIALILVRCESPYDPVKQKQPEHTRTDQTVSAGTLYGVNIGRQICNPSVSTDTVNYKGCMLWLNFSGDLQVKPGSFTGYTTTDAAQHDRLTVTDTSNTVRWYAMNTDFGLSSELQDPEWSNHPGYIAFLGGVGSGPAAKFYSYAVRISDKKTLKLLNVNIGGEATPFIWLPDTVRPGSSDSAAVYLANGCADSASIRRFFGTRRVKLVYAVKDPFLRLRFIDFSEPATSPADLPAPKGREDWHCESPLVSPDGNWIVYNCYRSNTVYECYVQRLRAGSKPVLVASPGSDPHWWTHPDNPSLQYVIYQTCRDNFVLADMNDPALTLSGQAGTTWKQQVFLASGDRASHALFELTGAPSELVKLPFKGGLSPDGSFLCTGYASGYILKLN